MPPSTTSTWPVMYARVHRRRGTRPHWRCRRASRAARGGSGSLRASRASGVSAAVMSVSMNPGATAFTRMFRDASSFATRLGEADQPRLARGVVRLPRVADEADHARDVDDPPRPPLHHAARRRAHRREGALQVRVEHRVPVIVLEAHQQVVAREAGVVHQDVERAEGPPPPRRRASPPAAASLTSQAKPLRAAAIAAATSAARARSRSTTATSRAAAGEPPPRSRGRCPRVLPVTIATLPVEVDLHAATRCRSCSTSAAVPRCAVSRAGHDALHEIREHGAGTELHEERIRHRGRQRAHLGRSTATGDVSCSRSRRVRVGRRRDRLGAHVGEHRERRCGGTRRVKRRAAAPAPRARHERRMERAAHVQPDRALRPRRLARAPSPSPPPPTSPLITICSGAL